VITNAVVNSHTVVNFINILQATVVPILLQQKITKTNCDRRKTVQSNLVQKRLEKNVDKIDYWKVFTVFVQLKNMNG